MGHWAVPSFRRPHELLDEAHNIDKAFAGGSIIASLGRIANSSKCYFGRRKKNENKMKQFPFYFVSEALSGAKLNYLELKKIAYTILMVSKKLN